MAAVRRTEKVFEFEEFGLPPLKVIVPEVLDSDYGMYTWPSAPVLARYVWKQQHDVRGKRVLELGSGTSLAGITAALVGAGGVVLSEREGNPQLLDNCQRTCTANNVPHCVVNVGEGVRFPEDLTTVTMATASAANTSTDRCHGDVQVIGLDWACFCPSLVTLPPVDIILGADCFYDQKDYENIIVTVSFLLERNPSCRFWTTYQERVSSHSIHSLLRRWKLNARSVPLESFDGDSVTVNGRTEPLAHTIHMLEIYRTATAADDDDGDENQG
eukprot:scpid64853/ scgid9534/ Methyltransferase-like protein 23